jgi:predicted  nucleic acid-binding Zn ribbon protein
MYLSQATFGPVPHGVDTAQAHDAVFGFLISLQKNGQLSGDFLQSLSGGKYVAFANLVRPDAARKQHHSQYALKELASIRELFGSEPSWRLLADHLPNSFHDFGTSSSLFLFSSEYDGESPLCCGDTGNRLPAYLIPIHDDERERLYFWSREYNRLDGVWLASGDLEIPAYRQLASPKSTLAKQGLALANSIERALGTPTYYFLMRYYGRGEREQYRRCPLCNGDWHVNQTTLGQRQFWHFPFRCVQCRLASQLADAAYDDQWAHIGEFPTEEAEEHAT